MTGEAVIVFDGACVLCNRWVDFVLRHDASGHFRFASMQGMHGRALLQAHGLSADDPTSFLLIEHGRGHTDTDAIVRLLQCLGGRWRWAARAIACVPRGARDAVYRWLARHRYRIFGRRPACRVPDPAVASRFLD